MSSSTRSHLIANIKDNVASSFYRNTAFHNVHPNLMAKAKDSYQDLFGELENGVVDPDRSVLSPAAYFVDLMRLVEKYITAPQGRRLQDRRADLWDVPLDRENTETELPYLQLVNTILEKQLSKALGTLDAMRAAASASYPVNLPYHAPLEAIRTYLRHFKTDLATVFETFAADPQAVSREQLGLSKQEYDLITKSNPSPEALKSIYGIDNFSDLIQVKTFMRQTGLTRKQLQELIYQNLSAYEIQNKSILRSLFINKNVGCLEIKSGKDKDGRTEEQFQFNGRVLYSAHAVAVGSRALFWGEADNSGKPTPMVNIYDSSGNWSTADLPVERARSFGAAASVSQKAIFFGGMDKDGKATAMVDIYDVATGTWSGADQLANRARSFLAAASIGQKVIFFGGKDKDGKASAMVDIYDVATGTWSQPDQLPNRARSFLAAASIGKKAIFFGGTDKDGKAGAMVDIYDDATGTWTQADRSLDRARSSAAATVVGQKALFFGGQKAPGTPTPMVDVYDAATQSWTTADRSGDRARSSVAAASVGHEALFFGGTGRDNKSSALIDIYDAAATQWRTPPDLSTNLAHSSAAAAVGDKAIFFGGADNTYKPTARIGTYDCKSGSWEHTDLDIILSGKAFDRLHRFIRLAKKFGWLFAELDWALRSINATELDGAAIQNLAKIKKLKNTFNLPLDVLCSFWFDMKTIGVGDRPVPNDLFDRLFNATKADPTFYKDQVMSWTIDSQVDPDRKIRAKLCAVLKISDEDLTKVAKNYFPEGGSIALTLANLTKLYRGSKLASSLGLRVSEYLLLLRLLDKPQVSGIDDVIDLADWTKWLKASGFNVYQLQYILLGEANAYIDTGRVSEEIRKFAEELKQAAPAGLVTAALFPQPTIFDQLVNKRILTPKGEVISNAQMEILSGLFPLSSKTAFFQGINPEQARLVFTSLKNNKIIVGEDGNARLAKAVSAKMLSFLTLLSHVDESIDESKVTEIQTLLIGISQNTKRVGDTLIQYRDLQEKPINEKLASFFEIETAAIIEGQKLFAELQDRSLTVQAWEGTLLPALLKVTASKDQTPLQGRFKTAIIQKLASLFQTDTVTMEQARSLSIKIVDKDGNKMPSFRGSDGGFVSTLERVLFMVKLLKLTAQDMQKLAENPAWFFGIKESATVLKLSDIRNIYTFKQITAAFNDTSDQLVGYTQPGREDQLVNLTGWPTSKDQLAALRTKLGNREPEVQTLARYKACFDLTKSIGIGIQYLLDLAAIPASENDSEAAWKNYQSSALAFFHAVNAKYDENQWKTVSSPMAAQLNERARDALASLLITRLNQPDIKTVEDLYGYLLVDVEMTGCMDISRIKLGINSLQLYIQRCRMGLEQGVIDRIPEKQWAWMAHYQLWAANRKVFLYPENYIDPSLRKGGTPLYAELKNELLQNEITDENVEIAYNNYFDKFEELSRLKIVDGCYGVVQDPGAGTTTNTLFLIGRTHTTPYTYYYRTAILVDAEAQLDVDNIFWKPWQKIELSINADTVSSIYAFHKLFVFWVEQTTEKHSASTDGKSYTITKASIKYTFQNVSQKWVQPQVLIKDRIIHIDNPSSASIDPKPPVWQKSSRPSALLWNKVSLLLLQQNSTMPETILVMLGDVNVIGNNQYKPVLPITALTSDLRSIPVDYTLSQNALGQYFFPDLSSTEGSRSLLDYRGPAFGLDGEKNYIRMDNITIPDNFKLETWFYWDGTHADRTKNIISKPSGTNSSGRFTDFFLQLGSDNLLGFLMANSSHEWGVNLCCSTPLSPEVWYRITITLLNDNVTFQIENVANNSSVYVGKSHFEGVRQKNNDPLLFGYFHRTDYDSGDHYWPGYIADVRIWDIGPASEGSTSLPLHPDFSITNQPLWSIWSGAKESFLVIPTGSPTQPLLILEGSVLKYATDPSSTKTSQRRFIRLTTNVIMPLSRKMLASGLSHLLTLESQYTAEYPFKNYGLNSQNNIPPSTNFLDFNGAYGSYYWEIFFHIPFLIANALNTNQRFEEAQKWYQRIFNPTAKGSSGYWSMDEGQGSSISDQITRQASAFRDGSPVWDTASDFPLGSRKVLKFNGSPDEVNIQLAESQRLSLSDDFMLEVWARVDSNQRDTANDDVEIISGVVDQNPYYPFEIRYMHKSGTVRAIRYDEQKNNPSITSKKLINDGKYHHIAFEKTGATLNLYIDGVLDATGKDTVIGDKQKQIGSLYLGRRGGEQNKNFFTGWLAEFRLWNIARPDEQIAMDMNTSGQHAADRFWQFRPFRGQTLEKLRNLLDNPAQLSTYEDDPFDPDAIARLRMGAYEKSVVMKYIDNLLDWGDNLFAQDGWEALVQATMRYILADHLLGKKPEQTRLPDPSPAPTFGTLNGQLDQRVGNLLKQLFNTDNAQIAPGSGPHDFDTRYFSIGDNEVFAQYWDQVDDRLYKIRHCLNIEGIFRQLALFEPPIDPRQVINALTSGNRDSLSTLPFTAVPHYRFSTMVQQAKSVASTLMQLGASLLSALEKKDVEELALRRATFEQVVLNIITQLKEKQIKEEEQNITSLQSSLDGASERYNRYGDWINTGLLPAEIAELDLTYAALAINIVALPVKGSAIPGYLSPTIFGADFGGMQPGAAIQAGATVLDGVVATLQQSAGLSATMAQHARRQQDWELQQALATYEKNQITAQIESAKLRQAIAQHDLVVHQKNIEQAQEMESLLKGKFTNQDLYQWMVGQISGIYFQTYHIALGLAQAAEKAYQFERNTDTTYIHAGHWDSLKKGLLAGESLMLELNQLEKAYIDGNSRELEIEKTISLLQLNPQSVMDLRKDGRCKFELTELLFDRDFPGHYCRKIKSMSISIPVLVGPYQDIHATLTQKNDHLLIEADPDAVQALLTSKDLDKQGSALRSNWGRQQQIAISRGVDDSGMFQLDFRDERYLPFEGTGVVSEWELKMPKAANRIDYNSISDVIIHLRYTALDGDEEFRNAVIALDPVKSFTGIRFVSIRQEFSAIWKAAKRPIQLPLTSIMFPSNLYGIQVTADQLKAQSLSISGGDGKYTLTELSPIPGFKPTNGNDLKDLGQLTINSDLTGLDDILLSIPYKATLQW